MLTNLQRHSVLFCIVIIFFWLPSDVLAHGVDENTRHFLLHNTGVQIIPFLYIGAKHMVTGYDHLLFLIGVVFFLYKSRDVVLYVRMFTLGHSLTLFFGVLIDLQVNAYLIDAIIGLSVAYKGFDNLGGVHQLFGKSANTKVAVLIFGLFHGLGLATKLQEFQLPDESLITNLIAFNLGVELGQFVALTFIVLAINCWRTHSSFTSFAKYSNVFLMTAGFMLVGFQLTGYVITL